MELSSPEEIQVVGKALDAAKDYADTVIKGPLSEFGGILSDTIGSWRLKNRVRLMLNTKKWLEDRGVTPTKILPDIFVPLLEDGGNVEDRRLADMFASLLASHLDSDKQETIHPSYTKVLSQLSPLDAQMMLAFRNLVSDRVARESGLPGPQLTVEFMAKEWTGFPLRSSYLSILNLFRLGILEHVGHRVPDGDPMPGVENNPWIQEYRMSEYGVSFCDACNYEKESGDENAT